MWRKTLRESLAATRFPPADVEYARRFPHFTTAAVPQVCAHKFNSRGQMTCY